jgi:hypothetical protein
MWRRLRHALLATTTTECELLWQCFYDCSFARVFTRQTSHLFQNVPKYHLSVQHASSGCETTSVRSYISVRACLYVCMYVCVHVCVVMYGRSSDAHARILAGGGRSLLWRWRPSAPPRWARCPPPELLRRRRSSSKLEESPSTFLSV